MRARVLGVLVQGEYYRSCYRLCYRVQGLYVIVIKASLGRFAFIFSLKMLKGSPRSYVPVFRRSVPGSLFLGVTLTG